MIKTDISARNDQNVHFCSESLEHAFRPAPGSLPDEHTFIPTARASGRETSSFKKPLADCPQNPGTLPQKHRVYVGDLHHETRLVDAPESVCQV